MHLRAYLISFKSLFKCNFLREAFPDYPVQIATLLPTLTSYAPRPQLYFCPWHLLPSDPLYIFLLILFTVHLSPCLFFYPEALK